MRLCHLGYCKLWLVDGDKWQIAQFWRLQGAAPGSPKPGETLWVGLWHWYFAVYKNPWENACEFIHRVTPTWQAGCDGPLQLHRGSTPKASLASLWALTCQLAGMNMLP